MNRLDFQGLMVLGLLGAAIVGLALISKAGWDQHRAAVTLENQEHRIKVYRDSKDVQILTDSKTGVEYLLFDGKALVRLESKGEIEKP